MTELTNLQLLLTVLYLLYTFYSECKVVFRNEALVTLVTALGNNMMMLVNLECTTPKSSQWYEQYIQLSWSI